MLKNYNELNNETRMLTGNINRMCVTDSTEELQQMYTFAKKRIDEIYQYNVNRLEQKIDD